MKKIKVKDLTTFQKQNMKLWLKEFAISKEEHIAYIALNFSGDLNNYENKYLNLVKLHESKLNSEDKRSHQKALERLNKTVTGCAIKYKNNYAFKKVNN